MKNLIILLFAFSIFYGCDFPPSESEILSQQMEQDSIRRMEDSLKNLRILEGRMEQEREDAAKAKRDSFIRIEENKVIGSINFGISKNQFRKQWDRFNKANARGKSPFTRYYIGEYSYSQYSNESYDNKKLYWVKIGGRRIHWDDFEREVPKQLRNIREILTAKFGKPSTTKELMERYKIKTKEKHLMDQWKIGNKVINIQLVSDGAWYKIDLDIFRKDVNDKLWDERRKKEKESQDSAKDKF